MKKKNIGFIMLTTSLALVVCLVILVLPNRNVGGLSEALTSKSSSTSSTFDKSMYERAYSEEVYLRDKVSKYENFLAYWVSTYVGFLGSDAQNTYNLFSVEFQDKGSFKSVQDLVYNYPLLNGVVDTVRVSYFYNDTEHELVQVVTVVRNKIGDERSVYVTYGQDLEIRDAWVSTSALDGGSGR